MNLFRLILSLFFLDIFFLSCGQHLESEKITILLPKNHVNNIHSIFFFDNNKKIVSISHDAIKLWDIQSGGKLINTLIGHNQTIDDAKLLKNSNKLITCSSDSTLKIWNLSNQSLEKSIKWDIGIPIKLFSSKDDNFVWISSIENNFHSSKNNYYLCLYDLNQNKKIKSIKLGSGSWLNLNLFEEYNFASIAIDSHTQIISLDNFTLQANGKIESSTLFKVEFLNPDVSILLNDVKTKIVNPSKWGKNEYAETYPPLSMTYYTDMLKINEEEIVLVGGNPKENKGFIQLINKNKVSNIIDKSRIDDFFYEEYLTAVCYSSDKSFLAIAGKSIYILDANKISDKYLKKIESPNKKIDDFEIDDLTNTLLISDMPLDDNYFSDNFNSDSTNAIPWRDSREIKFGKPSLKKLYLENFEIEKFNFDFNFGINNIKLFGDNYLLSFDNGKIVNFNPKLNKNDLNYISENSPNNFLEINYRYNEFCVGHDNGVINFYKFNLSKPYKSIKCIDYSNSLAFNENKNLFVFGNNDLNVSDFVSKVIKQSYSSIGIKHTSTFVEPKVEDNIQEQLLNKILMENTSSKDLFIAEQNISNEFQKSLKQGQKAILKINEIEIEKKDKVFATSWKTNELYWGGEDGYVYQLDFPLGNLKKVKVTEHQSILDIEISPDQKILAVGTGLYNKHLVLSNNFVFERNGKVLLYSLPSLKLLSVLGTHGSPLSKLKFSKDSKTLYSMSSEDGVIKSWDIERKILNWNYINLSNNNWIIITPDNYYYTSISSSANINFKIKNKIYNFDQFDLFFNRPDIVLKRIGMASKETIEDYKKAYQKRIEKLGFKESDLKIDYDQPETTILENNIPINTLNPFLKFNIEAVDTKFKLDKINVYVNDVPYYGIKGLSIRQLNTNKLRKEIQIPLSAENNKIEVSVHNQNGVESKREIIDIFYQTPIKKPSLYVVSIGVSDYQNKDKTLKYAAKDASDIVGLFNAKRDNYEKVELRNLKNQDVTKEKVLAIKQLLSKTNVDDKVILFVSGHGILDNDKNDWYFASQDMDFKKPSLRGISYDDLEGLLDGIPARNKLFLLDACHSGELDSEMNTLAINTKKVDNHINFDTQIKSKGGAESRNSALSNSFEAMKALFADTRRFSGANVISAASGDKKAFEGDEYNNGYFTYAFIDGIKTKKADKNQDGVIRVSELRDYIQKRVVEISKNNQVPTNRQENLANDFIIWTY